MTEEMNAYHELCAYTLSLRDLPFTHQHVVDAFMAQHADGSSKPIGITFALAGLYLHLEKGFTGKQVQHAHMQLAQNKRQWPKFRLPRDRGSMTAIDVLAAPEGPERQKAIDAWCASVWDAYRENRRAVIELLDEYGIV